MTEHEKLKSICDEIGCKYEEFEYLGNGHDRRVSVREMIFTPEFIDKLYRYMQKKEIEYDFTEFSSELINNLNNPVDYIYNLIK